MRKLALTVVLSSASYVTIFVEQALAGRKWA